MGQTLPQDKDTHVLNTLRTIQFINVNYTPLEPHMPLKYVVECISKTVHDVFPVIKNQKIIGLVWVDPIRELLFRPELYLQIQVQELMQPLGAFVKPDEEMAEVMKKFDESEKQLLPVVMGDKFMGFINKKEVLEKYRSVLRLQTSEN
jgi:CIC family chloride channel protein